MIEFAGYTHKKKKSTGLEMTSLIDMVFLLLIFFLLTSYYTKPTIPVTLPESASAKVNKDAPILLVVRRDGSVLIDNELIPKESLKGVLESLLASSPEKKVNIQADTGVQFGVIVGLMDIADQAGAGDILFVVEKKEVFDD